MKIKFNTKQRIFLASGLILLIVAFLIGFAIKPLLVEIKETSLAVEEKRNKLFILQEADQSYLEKLELDYEKVKKDIFLVASNFLNADQVVDFIVELEQVASSTSNVLEIKRADYPGFTLHLTGSFSNLMRYLGWLENGKYFVNANSIQIRRVDKDSFSPGEPAILIGNVKSVLEIETSIIGFDYD